MRTLLRLGQGRLELGRGTLIAASLLLFGAVLGWIQPPRWAVLLVAGFAFALLLFSLLALGGGQDRARLAEELDAYSERLAGFYFGFTLRAPELAANEKMLYAGPEEDDGAQPFGEKERERWEEFKARYWEDYRPEGLRLFDEARDAGVAAPDPEGRLATIKKVESALALPLYPSDVLELRIAFDLYVSRLRKKG